jgi:hypothetical protein
VSTRVLIIPEDPTLDKYILKPIVERIFDDLGKSALVEVLEDPHLCGVDEALDPKTMADIIRDRQMFGLFLLLVDRDCTDRANARKNHAQLAAQREAEHQGKLLACLAVEEVEVWMLALHRDALGANWSEVRAECHPKERFAIPFLQKKGWTAEVGRGRKRAMRALGAGYKGLLQVCPELDQLKQRIGAWLAERGV